MPTTHTISSDQHKRRQLRKVSSPSKTKITAKRIKAQIERVRSVDVAIDKTTWRLADELAKLVELEKQYSRRPVSGSALQAMTKFERNGSRLLLYARLAEFFPPALRKAGVGLRVYEAAYKFNQALKIKGRKPFTVEQLASFIDEAGTSSCLIQMHMKNQAFARDNEAIMSQRKALRNNAMENPRCVLVKKTWLKMIEEDSDVAIAAAIAVRNELDHIDRINAQLRLFGCDWHLHYNRCSTQIDLFEDEYPAAE